MTAQTPSDGGTDLPGWADWTTPGAAAEQVVEAVTAQVTAQVADVVDLVPGTPAAEALDGTGLRTEVDGEPDLDEYLTEKFAEEGAILTATQAQWDTFNEWS